MIVKTINNQTLLDLALQYYGTAEAISEIIRLNPDLKNDAVELHDMGRTTANFYFDIMLAADQDVLLDENSILIKKNVIKKISENITTYQRYGKNY